MNNPLDRQKTLLGTLAVFLGIFVMGYLWFHRFYIHEQWQNLQIKNLNEQLDSLSSQLSESSEKLKNLEEQEAILCAHLLKLLSFYQKLSAGFDVNVLIVGDSIGTQSWTNKFASDLEDTYGVSVKLENVSMGGNSSYAGYVRLMSLDYGTENVATDYDLVIFCYGQNDSIDDFAIHYEGMIRAVRSKYPHASIISILESSQKGYTEKIQVIQKLAKNYNILIVDTIDPFMNGIYGAYDQLTDDGTHPNSAGQKIYADTTVAVISTAVENGQGQYVGNISPVYDGVEKYDHFAWFGVEKFQKKGNTYILDLDRCISGTLGIYSSSVPGENSCRICVDNVEISNHEFNWPYDFGQTYITEISDYCTAASEIRISFENESQADGFYGICFNWE